MTLRARQAPQAAGPFGVKRRAGLVRPGDVSPRITVRGSCEDFASRAGTYPFPLRTPVHG